MPTSPRSTRSHSPSLASWTGSPAPDRTGALDLTDVAHVLSDLIGRTTTRVLVDDERKASAVARGLPAPVADFTLGMAPIGQGACPAPAVVRCPRDLHAMDIFAC